MQITARTERDVDERYTATFIGYWDDEENNLGPWTGFTDEWIKRNPNGVIAWIPRIVGGNTTDFDRATQQAYGETVRIFAVSPEGDVFFPNHARDMWPALYINSRDASDFVGFDIGSEPVRTRALELMLQTNDTAVADVSLTESSNLPGLAVLHPVFDEESAHRDVVGCTLKGTEVQHFVAGILDAMEFDKRYPAGHVAVFLQVGDSDDNYQMLFDYEKHPNGTADAFLSGEVTPMVVEKRGSESVTSRLQLTADKAIVVVASFHPNVNNSTSLVSLIAGCVASLLVALLVYGRQVLVLSYKDGMERATVVSSFRSRFVADMSHEIRTPLNGIIGTSELLAEERLSTSATQLVDTIQACSSVLMGM